MTDTADFAATMLKSGIGFDDPRQRWWLEDGSLDVFAAPINTAGEQTGTGRYLFTLAPGQVGFGIVPCPLADGSRLAIRAKRVAGTAASPAQIAFAADESASPDLIEAIDAWLVRLAGSLRNDGFPDMTAQPDQERQQASTGVRIGSPRGLVLWLEPQKGALAFLAREGATALPGEPPVPVPDGYWAQASKPVVFSAWTTATLMKDSAGKSQLWDAFALANKRLIALIADDFLLTRARETTRIAGRLRQSRAAFADGLRRAGFVLRGEFPLPDLDAVDDPMFAAASIVAARQRIVLQRIAAPSAAAPGDHLSAICRASHINLRPVKLEHDWFRHDSGPILGFARDSDGATHPLALLPRKISGYDAVDPERGERYRINADKAEHLLPTAYVFYRGFDAAPVTTKNLVRFGLQGMGRDLARVFIMGLLGGLLSLVLPAISQVLFNDVLPRADISMLATVILALAVGALSSAAFRLVRGFSLLRVEGRMEADIQAAVWDRLLHLTPGFFRNYTTGDLADRVMSVTAIRSVITSAISGSILDAVFSLVSFALMFWYSWQLALIAAGLALIAVLLTAGLTALQIPHQSATMQDTGRVSGFTHQLLTAIGKVRVAGAEERVFGRWTGMLAQQKRRAYLARRIAAVQYTLTQAFPPLTSVVLYVALIKLGESVGNSDRTVPLLTLGEYMAFTAAFGQFVTALMSMVAGLTSLIGVVPLYERFEPVLIHSPEASDGVQLPGTLTGHIEFRRVTFRYQENQPPVLDNLSFQVEPGEYVALVGPSGSGKSTIERLALGFETPQSGSIFFDHRDLATLDLDELRRQIGVVLQNDGLLAGSLFENIVGSLPISMDEAWEAVRLAGLDADIRQLPMGMHTRLSDSAPMLSGGQQQRLIIARALVRKPRVLIFDEATSSLDNRAQAIVNETLARLNLTRIVIAHRLSTVRDTDRILVLKQGRIVETGNYNELLARAGEFARLAKHQML